MDHTVSAFESSIFKGGDCSSFEQKLVCFTPLSNEAAGLLGLKQKLTRLPSDLPHESGLSFDIEVTTCHKCAELNAN